METIYYTGIDQHKRSSYLTTVGAAPTARHHDITHFGE